MPLIACSDPLSFHEMRLRIFYSIRKLRVRILSEHFIFITQPFAANVNNYKNASKERNGFR